IPVDILDRVMEPFVTTKPAGEGTGLGLAICQRIMEQVEGDITITNRVDGGGVEVALHFKAVP
ncbi:HAMP domain-containing histidine kinase, partial [bacterium]|nr:HAMP domain-containing histidine kinase [candidate division CSSED10-310 bacterium]